MNEKKNDFLNFPEKNFYYSKNLKKLNNQINSSPSYSSNISFSSINSLMNLNKTKRNSLNFDENKNIFLQNNSFNSFQNLNFLKYNKISNNSLLSLEHNFNKSKKFINRLNEQINKIHYFNLIQKNSFDRLNLYLIFLNTQIDTLKYLNKKRKIHIEKKIKKIKK